jgi:hypothetical protein
VTDAFLFLSRELYPLSQQALAHLRATVPEWAEVHVVGFDPDRVSVHEVADDLPHPHTLYGWDDVAALDVPVKMTAEDGRLQLVPGNMDWIMLRFAQLHPEYDAYWWAEDDVRFRAPWSILLEALHDRPEGFLTTRLRTRADEPDWDWWETVDYPEGVVELASFNPFGRLTHPAIDAVLAAYRAGWKGHHESFLASAVATAGLGVYDVADWYDDDSFRWRPFHLPPVPEGPKLWHPVRGRADRKARHAAKSTQLGGAPRH